MQYSLEQRKFPIPELRVAMTVKEIQYLMKYTDFRLYYESDKIAFDKAIKDNDNQHIKLESIETEPTNETSSVHQLIESLLKTRPNLSEEHDLYLRLVSKLKEIETFWKLIVIQLQNYMQFIHDLGEGLDRIQ